MAQIKTDPFGRGIVTPFRRDQRNDFANDSGTVVLKSDVGQLLGIIGPSANQPGELPWRTELGGRLITLKHRGIHKELTRATAEANSTGVLRRWESRVRPGPATLRVRNETELHIAVRYFPLGFSQSEPDSVELTPIT